MAHPRDINYDRNLEALRQLIGQRYKPPTVDPGFVRQPAMPNIDPGMVQAPVRPDIDPGMSRVPVPTRNPNVDPRLATADAQQFARAQLVQRLQAALQQNAEQTMASRLAMMRSGDARNRIHTARDAATR